MGGVVGTQSVRDAARRLWRDGLRLDPRNETLLKTLERFGVTP